MSDAHDPEVPHVPHETKLVDLEQRQRMEHYFAAARTMTLIVVGLAIIGLLVFAIRDSQRALELSRKAERNLCEAQNKANANDVETIRGNPRETVALLKKLGFTKKQIDDYLKAAYAPGGPVDRAIKARPQLQCGEQAKPVPRSGTITATATTTTVAATTTPKKK